MHEDDQMAVKVRPQFELLFNVLNGFAGRFSGPVGIAGQGIPTDFNVAQLFNGRPESIGKVTFRSAGAREIIGRTPMTL